MARLLYRCVPNARVGCTHYEVLGYPVAEMGADTPLGIVSEFITLTRLPAWHETGRRPAEAGDLVLVGAQVFELVPESAGKPVEPYYAHLGVRQTTNNAYIHNT